MQKKERTTAYGNNRGAALITVVAVVMVLMVIILSLVAVAYQYYMLESNEMNEQKCREVVESMSKELQDEIAGKKYNDFAALSGDTTNDNALWRYLRENVGQPNWAYYDETDGTARKAYAGSSDPFAVSLSALNRAGDVTEATRVFDATIDKSGVNEEELPPTTVKMYWTPGTYSDRLQGAKLHVVISAKMGDYQYTIKDVYTLETGRYVGVSDAEVLDTTEVHPGENIYKYQKWEWVYAGEE